MSETLFGIKDGKVYFNDNKGYGLEECVGILNGIVDAINKGIIMPTKQQGEKLNNVVNYEDILDKRVIAGDSSKSTLKLKEWLDNDPDVIAEDEEDLIV